MQDQDTTPTRDQVAFAIPYQGGTDMHDEDNDPSYAYFRYALYSAFGILAVGSILASVVAH
jgi:hypothetical protein